MTKIANQVHKALQTLDLQIPVCPLLAGWMNRFFRNNEKRTVITIMKRNDQNNNHENDFNTIMKSNGQN